MGTTIPFIYLSNPLGFPSVKNTIKNLLFKTSGLVFHAWLFRPEKILGTSEKQAPDNHQSRVRYDRRQRIKSTERHSNISFLYWKHSWSWIPTIKWYCNTSIQSKILHPNLTVHHFNNCFSCMTRRLDSFSQPAEIAIQHIWCKIS